MKKKFWLYVCVFAISFMAFHKVAAPIITTPILGDTEETYNISFDLVTEADSRLVLFDNRGLENITYYVYEFTGDQYVAYTYTYLANEELYAEYYAEHATQIVDYNYDECMIKTLDDVDYGTFDTVMEMLSDQISNNTLYVVY